MQYRFSAHADRDVQSIARYIARDSIRSARRVREQIEKTCERIAAMPGSGARPTYVIDPAVRVMPVSRYKSYLIFYRQVSHHIEIVRILHGARDLPTAFYK